MAELEHYAVVDKIHHKGSGASVYTVNARTDIQYGIAAGVERSRSLEVEAQVKRIAGIFTGGELIEIHMAVKSAVDDLHKVLLLLRPVVHGGHIFSGLVRPLDDKGLTCPAAA